jgi:NYN domain
MRVAIYVDGESHFIRTQAAVRRHLGAMGHLPAVRSTLTGIGSAAFPDVNQPYLRCEPAAKFFWDTFYLFLAPRPFNSPHITGGVYFSAVSGDESAFHASCVAIRRNGCGPRGPRERSQLESQRANRLEQNGILEKAKGVDIGLAVRLLEDAYHNNFDACFLFTCDIDFMPVARIIQRMGKKVFVFGYSEGLGALSEFEYAPDGFVDLSQHVQSKYVL